MNDPPEIVCQTRFLRLVRQDGWEFVQRANATGVVCIAALTDDGCVLLVEQFRPPVAANVIELPAGLAGDEPGASTEDLMEAARRELLEETGYEAAQMKQVFAGVTSAGITDELITFFVARGLTKKGSGGGTGHEKITLHHVPLTQFDEWLVHKLHAGCMADARLYTGIYLLRQLIPSGTSPQFPPQSSSQSPSAAG